MRSLSLGQSVTFKDTIRRSGKTTHDEKGTKVYAKTWVRTADWFSFSKAQPGRGILVGLRTLQDGTQPLNHGGEDDWASFGGFKRTNSRSVAIIATSLRRKPVMAFLEDVSALIPDHTDSARVQDNSATKETL